MNPNILICLLICLLVTPLSVNANLVVKVREPKVTGNKAIIKLELKNTFTEKIESARAVVFLLDDQGKMVAQSTKWVIGGTKERPALAAGATNAFHFVVASDKPFASTNLTAKVQFNRLVLVGGKLADVSKSVHVENKAGVR